MSPSSSNQRYKVKLESGRILGPLDLARIRLLLLKNQITGNEVAREHPNGEWKPITEIPALSQLLVLRAGGRLTAEPSPEELEQRSYQPISNARPGAALAATQILPIPTHQELQNAGPKSVDKMDRDEKIRREAEARALREEELHDHTDSSAVAAADNQEGDSDEMTTVVPNHAPRPMPPDQSQKFEVEKIERSATMMKTNVAFEPTIAIARPKLDLKDEPQDPQKKVPLKELLRNPKLLLRTLALAAMLGFGGYELILNNDSEIQTPTRLEAVRPKLPEILGLNPDPKQSAIYYTEGLKNYVQDHVMGYRLAADNFRKAASLDPGNVKADAMLASSYLNLIDSSNKDENYFTVISRLIELSSAKAIDLQEAVIADVEFFLTVNKPEAAQNRIVEYNKSHQSFDLVMFYYLALSFYQRGDAQQAVRFLNQIPENKIVSAKVYYLRGLIAEKLADSNQAISEYRKAIKFNKSHVKSRLKLAELLEAQGKLGETGPNLEYVLARREYLPPRELAHAYYLHGRLSQLHKDMGLALSDLERAVALDRENHDYLLELYTLRAKSGDSVNNIRKEARMYFYLGEGERLIKAGKYQDALVQFLQAREANDKSPLPAVKLGDMFSYISDMGNARANYKLAADRAPNSIEIWSKYINILIQSYEWEEAQRAMNRFRKLAVPQSAIDKAAADMYQKQGKLIQAQVYYRKAMARSNIDSDVYLAYARSLMSTKNYKEAPFFFALALRFDPLNMEALVSTAKCVAATDSIDRGISILQDELQKGTGARAELLAGIAELQLQKGALDQAQENISQAMAANPEFAAPFKLQAQYHLARENIDRAALDKALISYESYSERNASDPSGYMERYSIFVRQTRYDKAAVELDKVYSVLPKYPNLHYFKALLYSLQGNHKVAVEELKTELANNGNNALALLGMGKELITLQDYNGALEFLNKAMRAAPQSAEAKQMGGYANFLLKNYEGAIALFRAALAFDTGNPLIYKRLGVALCKVNNSPAAMDAFRKYRQLDPDAPDRANFNSCP